MIPALFVAFVLLVATMVVAGAARWLPGNQARIVGVVLLAWLSYVGGLSWAGVAGDPALRPPGIAYIVGPAVAFVLFGAVRSAWAGRLAAVVPPWALIALQTYRVGVEIFLHRLWVEDLVPRMLTFEGANVDVWIGASAPVIAWLTTRGRGGRGVALSWNVLGLLALANVAIRSALTAPGPLHMLGAEVTNRAIGTFPYTFIAGFLAPLAVVLHVLALRSLARHPGEGPVNRPRASKRFRGTP